MSFKATVFKVMIASPSDVTAERNIIRDVLSEWNAINAEKNNIVLLPVSWESHSAPEVGNRPQAIINKQILRECDLLVGVFWTRIGTDTGEYISGTVEEIEEHIKHDKPTMLYFSQAPVIPDSVDRDQYNKLKEFRDSCRERGLFETYATIEEFRNKFYRQLQLILNKHEYFIRESEKIIESTDSNRSASIPQLTREAQILLKEATQDPHGQIMRLHFIGGVNIQTNSKPLLSDNSPREIAKWEGAIEELESLGFIKPTSHKREIFTVTREGYEVAELLRL